MVANDVVYSFRGFLIVIYIYVFSFQNFGLLLKMGWGLLLLLLLLQEGLIANERSLPGMSGPFPAMCSFLLKRLLRRRRSRNSHILVRQDLDTGKRLPDHLRPLLPGWRVLLFRRVANHSYLLHRDHSSGTQTMGVIA